MRASVVEMISASVSIATGGSIGMLWVWRYCIYKIIFAFRLVKRHLEYLIMPFSEYFYLEDYVISQNSSFRIMRF